MISKFMLLANSFMNPLVYLLRIPAFRGAIRDLISCYHPFRRAGIAPLKSSRGIEGIKLHKHLLRVAKVPSKFSLTHGVNASLSISSRNIMKTKNRV